MMLLLNLLLAIVPSLLISFFIFRFDRHEPEKILPLVICFLLGVIVTYPAMQVQVFADGRGVVESPSFWMTVLLSFVVVALTEELVKFIPLIAYPFPRSFFNEPLDGIVYAVMIGMGFATLENILYALQYGTDTMAIRAFTAVPAHGTFGVISGYFVGRAKFEKEQRWLLIALGLLSAVGLHGLYDFFILQQHYDWLISFSTLTLAVSIYLSYAMLKAHRLTSAQQAVQMEVTETFVTEELAATPSVEENDIMKAVLDDLRRADEEE